MIKTFLTKIFTDALHRCYSESFQGVVKMTYTSLFYVRINFLFVYGMALSCEKVQKTFTCGDNERQMFASKNGVCKPYCKPLETYTPKSIFLGLLVTCLCCTFSGGVVYMLSTQASSGDSSGMAMTIAFLCLSCLCLVYCLHSFFTLSLVTLATSFGADPTFNDYVTAFFSLSYWRYAN